MRAIRENLDVRGASAQLVGESSGETRWHFHPEFELIAILAGSGLRLIGDDVGVFAAGEVLLLGPDLPHSWTSASSPSEPARAAVIHFSSDATRLLEALPGSTSVLDLFQAAGRGALVRHPLRETINDITRIADDGEVDPRSLSRLLLILADLADCQAEALASSVAGWGTADPFRRRIETVCNYLLEHHSEQITLAEAASVAAMTPAAFSRFFHRSMGKPFTQYLNQLRVHRACTLLLTSDIPIIDIAAAAGFVNLSNFNRRFRQHKGTTPSEYRRHASAAIGHGPGQN